MLSHFSVKNYKCLADVSLPLTPIHVLIGQNDTGKTSLLEAIRSSFASISRFNPESNELREAFPGEWKGRELIWNKSAEPAFETTLGFDDLTKSRTGIGSTQFSWMFGEENRPLKTANDKAVDVGLSGVWFDGISMRLRSTQILKDTLSELTSKLAQNGTVNYCRFQPRILSRPSGLSRPPKYSLDEDGFGLPALLDEIKDYNTGRFLELQSAYNKYFPQYNLIRLQTALAWTRNRNQEQTVDLKDSTTGKQIWLAANGGDVRLQQASDGAVLLLGFLALMYSPKPPDLLLIEEPENGIHPQRLVEVAKLLREFVEREKNAPQIILTTHSPYLLSEFNPEEVTLMKRQNDGSVKAYPLRDAKHIHERMGNEFYLGELWYNLTEEELLK